MAPCTPATPSTSNGDSPAHHRGLIHGYTRRRRPVRLVWSQEFPTRDEALAAERRIKGWTRAKKEALIAHAFELLEELSISPSRRAYLDTRDLPAQSGAHANG